MVLTIEQKDKKTAFSLARRKSRSNFEKRSIKGDEMSQAAFSSQKGYKHLQRRNRGVTGTVPIAGSSAAARKSWQRFAAKHVGKTIFVKGE